MNIMIRKLFFALVFCSTAGIAEAAKLYKIIDENGNVTFSQHPPNDAKKKGATIEGVNVSSGGTSSITEIDGRKYCGDIRLPRKSSNSRRDSEDHYHEVRRKLQHWRSRLQRIERSAAEYSRRKVNVSQSRYYNSASDRAKNNATMRYQSGMSKANEGMRDLRCAIEWAQNINHEQAKDSIAQTRSERERLQGIKDRLNAQLDRRCGPLPKYDPSDPVIKGQRARWYRCSEKIRDDLQTINRQLGRL